MSEFEKLMKKGSARKVVKARIDSTDKFWKYWRWSMVIGLILIPVHIGWLVLSIGGVWGLLYACREGIG